MPNRFITSIIISLIFLSTGFALLHNDVFGYGISFFVFLPFILGYILGSDAVKKGSLAGLIFSLVIFFILLLAGGLEGMVCILMAMPLALIAIALGVFIRHLVNKATRNKKDSNLVKSSILPFIILLTAGLIEKQITAGDREIISVKTEIILPYTPLEVYDAIKSVDTVIAEKTWLMKLDLPVPVKCVLDEEKEGGIRTCYFGGGKIVEKITHLEKGKVQQMDVIDYQLTGRKWLGFEEAIYLFEETGTNSCKLTRITTYTSTLTPRFYWEPLEKTGIGQEHDYVFEHIENFLKNTR